MEGNSKIESFIDFDSLLKRVEERYKSEGFSDRVKNEIGSWADRCQFSTDGMGGTLESRIKFQYELAQLYIATDQIESARQTLDDALIEAEQSVSPLETDISQLLNLL